jgi:SAM-dependent methyltransferase
MTEMQGMEFFRCPRCRQALEGAGPGAALCSGCSQTIARPDGILDFVASKSATQLDDIDYDQFYRIDEEALNSAFLPFMSILGGRLQRHYQDVVEIGAGTGRSTISFLRQIRADRFVVTDISTKMLGILGRKLSERRLTEGSSIHLATFSGVEDCFAENSFDLAFGLGILHHIPDYRNALSILYRSLKPGGSALFNEPTLDYYRALIYITLEIYRSMMANPAAWNPADVREIIEWTSTVDLRIKYHEHPEFLSHLEDKHLFRGAEVRALGEELGFEVEIFPVGVKGKVFSHPELMYLGLTKPGYEQFQSAFRSRLPGVFELMPESEVAPAYLIWLTKPRSPRAAASVRTPLVPAPPPPPEDVVNAAECEFSLSVRGARVEGAPAGPAPENRALPRPDFWSRLLLKVPGRALPEPLRQRATRLRTAKVIAGSGLFDSTYYLAQAPEAARSGIHPLFHWLQSGAAQNLNPSYWFDTAFYLQRYPDVARAGVNPLEHFIECGHRERRNPHPEFDTAFYLRTYPDVAASGMNPLLHFVRWGLKEGRLPNPGYRADSAAGLDGWIVAPRAVERIRVSAGPWQRDFAVGKWRPDVLRKLKNPDRFPFRNLIFCGVVNGSTLTPSGESAPSPTVAVQFDTGQWLQLGEVAPVAARTAGAEQRGVLRSSPANGA